MTWPQIYARTLPELPRGTRRYLSEMAQEKTLFSECHVIFGVPEQLYASWSATQEGQWANLFLDAGGPDVMYQDKMWQLMLHAWLGAGSVAGLAWNHICAMRGLTRYESSSKQALAVVKFAMLDTQV